ncbi:MAG: histidine phosphatase family protein [Candidatus Sericytochromatia bacterium]|nr:histidine phosphatase family protein [Candidatus Sericytochromatia bacterium]
MNRRIFLVRHAPIEVVSRGLIIGRTDVPIEPLPDAFVGPAPWPAHAHWVVSSALRAQQTARWLGGGTWRDDADWWEQDHGLWEGKTWGHLWDTEPLAREYLDQFTRVRPPNGEHLGDVRRRAVRAFSRLPKETDAVVVAHAGSIRCVLAWALQWPTRRAPFLEVAPLSCSVLQESSGGWRLLQLNVPLGTAL